LSSLVVTKVLGVVAFAQFTIGKFGEPVVLTLRNSVSAVVLPEMVRRDRDTREHPLALWRRATVLNTILLLPVVVVVWRYAQPLVETVFGRSYAPAALVLQIYLLVVVRECFDFAPALRALNRTRPLVESSVASIVACALLLVVLVPADGVAGAMWALVLSTVVEALWLARATMRHYGVSLGELIPWGNVAKVAGAALLAAAVLATSAWRDVFGAGGMALATAVYVTVFALLLLALKVPEAQALLAWMRRCVPALTTVCRKA
jgi:O-antigen/teichoic acid export membrane protein